MVRSREACRRVHLATDCRLGSERRLWEQCGNTPTLAHGALVRKAFPWLVSHLGVVRLGREVGRERAAVTTVLRSPLCGPVLY